MKPFDANFKICNFSKLGQILLNYLNVKKKSDPKRKVLKILNKLHLFCAVYTMVM